MSVGIGRKAEWNIEHDKKSVVTSLEIYGYEFYKEITHLRMADVSSLNISYYITIKHLFILKNFYKELRSLGV